MDTLVTLTLLPHASKLGLLRLRTREGPWKYELCKNTTNKRVQFVLIPLGIMIRTDNRQNRLNNYSLYNPEKADFVDPRSNLRWNRNKRTVFPLFLVFNMRDRLTHWAERLRRQPDTWRKPKKPHHTTWGLHQCANVIRNMNNPLIMRLQNCW